MVCALCGLWMYSSQGSNAEEFSIPMPWLSQYRILYASKDGGVGVSGVGNTHPHDGDYYVPPHYDQHWYDEGVRCDRSPGKEGREAVFHEVCWALIERAYHPMQPPLRQLVKLSKLLPLPTRAGRICTTYVNVAPYETFCVDVDRFPWADRILEMDQPALDCFSPLRDPWIIPEINHLQHKKSVKPISSLAVSGTSNCLTRLPMEVVVEIATYLPTRDALRAREASPAFLPIFDSQRFWASRFTCQSDRGWLFEALDWSLTCDWKHIYHCTNRAHATQQMKNRENIWRLIQRVKEIASATRGTPFTGAVVDNEKLTWRDVTTRGSYRVIMDINMNHEGNQEHQRGPSVFISPSLSKIAFATTISEDVTYIAGLRLIQNDHCIEQLGYTTNNETVLDASELYGFELTVGRFGIHGVRCVYSNDTKSTWVGKQDAPKTRRLIFTCQLTAIWAEFDDWKMVSFGAAARTSEVKETAEFRDLSCWYPEYLPAGVAFTAKCFSAPYAAQTTNDPLRYTMFGGAGGIYLRHLKGISLTCNRESLRGIEFDYDIQSVPIDCRKVGAFPSDSQSSRFEIDGAGGERITSLTVSMPIIDWREKCDSTFEGDDISSIEVTTSRGRSLQFEFGFYNDSSNYNFRESVLAVPPAGIITGIVSTGAYNPDAVHSFELFHGLGIVFES